MAEAPDEIDAAILLCATGDRSGLSLIYEREAGRLVGVAQRLLRRRELAEDAVQDAFVQIWRKAGQFSPASGSGRGWIYAILRNRCLNMLRDGRREELMPVEELDDLRERQTVPDTDLELARLSTDSRLRACLDGLDPQKRDSILMAYCSGYTHGEIAGRLGVPLGTAKAWVRRGLSALRECMA